MQLAIIPPLATIFTHNSIRWAVRLLCNNVYLLRNEVHEHQRAKRLNAVYSRDHLYVTTITGFVKGVHSFQPNRQKGP